MIHKILPSLFVLICLTTFPAAAGPGQKTPLVFASFAEEGRSLENVLLMAESLRTFGGAHAGAPVWVYLPTALRESVNEDTVARCNALHVDLRTSEAPADALWFYFARKVFAAARAETDAAAVADVLAWVDEDTLFLDEPVEFILPAGVRLGYRPVMHRNIGNLYDEPLDEFWSRAYELMVIDTATVFPMLTPADEDKIRPYFNAGCLVVRPAEGILSRWPGYFRKLYSDPALAEMCRQDVKKRIFIHQAALTGTLLNHVPQEEMKEFSSRINYPLFFKQLFGARREFNDLTGVVTIRHESFFRNFQEGWERQLRGPADRIRWLKEHLVRR
jgi:hypothetical protein